MNREIRDYYRLSGIKDDEPILKLVDKDEDKKIIKIIERKRPARVIHLIERKRPARVIHPERKAGRGTL